jgi:thiamine-monophosphate kinase
MLIGRYRLPQPRTALAGAVHDYAHAAMDVSDGLAGDPPLCVRRCVRRHRCPERPLSAAAAALLARRDRHRDHRFRRRRLQILCAI